MRMILNGWHVSAVTFHSVPICEAHPSKWVTTLMIISNFLAHHEHKKVCIKSIHPHIIYTAVTDAHNQEHVHVCSRARKTICQSLSQLTLTPLSELFGQVQ
jgi:hypothetical protein